MSKIKIFALGGLNENGKNMYIVNVDEDIFVFDAGLKYDNDLNLGIDYIIPNFDYLTENKSKVKGIFLTHGHEGNMGAVPDILGALPDSLRPHESQHARPPCPSPAPRVHPNSCASSW